MKTLIRELKNEGIQKSEIYEILNNLCIRDIDNLIDGVKHGKKINFEQEKAIILFRKMQHEELVDKIYQEKER